MENLLKDAGFQDVKVGTKTVHAIGMDVKDLCEHIMAFLSRYIQQWNGLAILPTAKIGHSITFLLLTDLILLLAGLNLIPQNVVFETA